MVGGVCWRSVILPVLFAYFLGCLSLIVCHVHAVHAAELDSCSDIKEKRRAVRKRIAQLEARSRKSSFPDAGSFSGIVRRLGRQSRRLGDIQSQALIACPDVRERDQYSSNNSPTDGVVNLILNPGFENGMLAWTASALTKTVSLPVHSGNSALEIPSSERSAQRIFQDFPVSSGANLNVSVWTSSEAAAQLPILIAVKWFNASIPQGLSGIKHLVGLNALSRTSALLPEAWTLYVGNIVTPPEAIQGRLDIMATRTDITSVLHVDDAIAYVLNAGSTPTPAISPEQATPLPTATVASTNTPLQVPTATPVQTATSTVTRTSTTVPSATATPSATTTPMPTMTATVTSSFTPTRTRTSTATVTPAPSLPYGDALPVDFFVCDCAQGADVDCIAGSDTNDGLSAAAPWRTYERARQQFANLQAGQTIGFCAGGFFNVGSQSPAGYRWINPNCRADRLCSVTSYQAPWASADEGRPIIQNLDGGAIDFSESGTVSQEQGYRFRSLELRGAAMSLSFTGTFPIGPGISIENDVDTVYLENLLIKGFTIGVHVNHSFGTLSPPADGQSSAIILRDSLIINNGFHGWLGGASNSVIENNRFENNAYADEPGRGHNISWTGSQGATNNSRISGNILYRNAIVGGSCQAVSLVAHGTHSDLVIEDNLIYEDIGRAAPSCWGIGVDNGNPSSEEFQRLLVRRNRIIDVGNLGIGCTSCTNSIIENNVIIHTQAHSIRAIAVPNRQRGAEDSITTGVTVRNNSILMASSGSAITVGTDEGSGFVVVSNAIHYTGIQNSFNCLNLPLPAASYEAVDYNLCFFSGVNAEWEEGSGTEPNALDAWRSESGFDANSMFLDPLFSSALVPSAEGVIGAAHPTLSASDDIIKSVRDSSPDIGAYEVGE